MVGVVADGMVAQRFDHPAIGDAPAPTLLDHPFELAAQFLKPFDPSFDPLELRLRDGVCGFAGLFGHVAETQQVADGREGESQGSSTPDEQKPADVFSLVEPLVAFRTGGSRQEADLLVLPDRLHLAAGRPGGPPDRQRGRHAFSP